MQKSIIECYTQDSQCINRFHQMTYRWNCINHQGAILYMTHKELIPHYGRNNVFFF